MKTRILQVLMRVALLVALVASTALYLEYTDGSPTFCGDGGGCAAVKASAFSHLGGVGLPTIGLGGFAALFLGALLVSKPVHARALAGLLGAAAAAAVMLIGTQIFVLKAICPWCMLVDGSTIVAFAAAFLVARGGPEVEPWPIRFAWLVAGAVAIGGPVSWAGAPVATVELPPELASLQKDGVTDVIMFTDFECPYCRRLHAALHARVTTQPGSVALRRFMAPLPFHPAAEPAARAYVCAPEATREAMADGLYGADFSGLHAEKAGKPEELELALGDMLVGIATKAGLDKEAFVTCLESELTKRKVAEEFELYRSMQLPGLPTTFVENRRIVGADVRALDLALGGSDLRMMFGLLALVFVCAAGLSLYRPANDGDGAETPAEGSAASGSEAAEEDDAAGAA
ncbi:MAG: DsbA family protein [Deltaproteobacteria bacterium]|nr:DsbA family protein [Deltaproteobacteria bacterium]